MSEPSSISEYLLELHRELKAGLSRRREILAEAEDHLRQAAHANVAGGMAMEEAERAAIRTFGSPAEVADRFGADITGALEHTVSTAERRLDYWRAAHPWLAALLPACVVWLLLMAGTAAIVFPFVRRSGEAGNIFRFLGGLREVAIMAGIGILPWFFTGGFRNKAVMSRPEAGLRAKVRGWALDHPWLYGLHISSLFLGISLPAILVSGAAGKWPLALTFIAFVSSALGAKRGQILGSPGQVPGRSRRIGSRGTARLGRWERAIFWAPLAVYLVIMVPQMAHRHVRSFIIFAAILGAAAVVQLTAVHRARRRDPDLSHQDWFLEQARRRPWLWAGAFASTVFLAMFLPLFGTELPSAAIGFHFAVLCVSIGLFGFLGRQWSRYGKETLEQDLSEGASQE